MTDTILSYNKITHYENKDLVALPTEGLATVKDPRWSIVCGRNPKNNQKINICDVYQESDRNKKVPKTLRRMTKKYTSANLPEI